MAERLSGSSLSGSSQVRGAVFAASMLLVGAVASAQAPAGGWSASFATPTTVKGSGLYRGDAAAWVLESFSPLELEASASATFQVTDVANPLRSDMIPGQRRLIFRDTRPGLKPNPDAGGGAPFYVREEGSIIAMGWVDQMFTDGMVTADVNTEGGVRGAGSYSRQGVMARWDKTNNWYWFYVDYASGEYGIWRTTYFGNQQLIPGSSGPINDFDNRKTYRVEFRLEGPRLRGRVYDVAGLGARSRQVGDTGVIIDAEPLQQGVSGVLAGLALSAPYEPLEASFANVNARPLSGAAAATTPSLAKLTADVQKAPELGPGSYRDHYELAQSLAKNGNAVKAIEHYKAALMRVPDDVPALKNLAWIQATHPDANVRDPASAIEHADRALDSIMRAINNRHEAEVSNVYTKAYILKVVYTQAAAYAAAGKFRPQPLVNEYRTDAAATPTGPSPTGTTGPTGPTYPEEPLPYPTGPTGPSGPTCTGETCGCDAASALGLLGSAIEAARHAARETNTVEAVELVRRFENAQALYEQGKALVGESQL